MSAAMARPLVRAAVLTVRPVAKDRGPSRAEQAWRALPGAKRRPTGGDGCWIAQHLIKRPEVGGETPTCRCR
jgi:hypothetical protein